METNHDASTFHITVTRPTPHRVVLALVRSGDREWLELPMSPRRATGLASELLRSVLAATEDAAD